jgi:hypothetical protein
MTVAQGKRTRVSDKLTNDLMFKKRFAHLTKEPSCDKLTIEDLMLKLDGKGNLGISII